MVGLRLGLPSKKAEHCGGLLTMATMSVSSCRLSSGQNTQTPSGSAVCTSTITTRGIIQARRICCCSQPATSYLSPSARCAPVNGLAGCYVSTIGKPHEYFDLTGTGKKSLLQKWAETTLRHKDAGTLARTVLKTT